MIYDREPVRQESLPHSMTLEGRASMSVSGVEDVESFDEAEIILFTTAGLMTVHGRDLHIEKLSLDGGEMEINGQIDSIQYEDTAAAKGSSFWSRLLR